MAPSPDRSAAPPGPPRAMGVTAGPLGVGQDWHHSPELFVYLVFFFFLDERETEIREKLWAKYTIFEGQNDQAAKGQQGWARTLAPSAYQLCDLGHVTLRASVFLSIKWT